MLQTQEEHKNRGVPKKRKDYRAWRRNNAISWKGVAPDRVKEYPPLVKQRSDRGEVHYVRLWDF